MEEDRDKTYGRVERNYREFRKGLSDLNNEQCLGLESLAIFRNSNYRIIFSFYLTLE
jgi:hypothetical protein